MQKIKKWLRLLAFSLLIVLALVGVGIFGIPVRPQNNKDEKVIEIEIEEPDDENEDALEVSQEK